MPAYLKELSSTDTTTTSDIRNYVSKRLTHTRFKSYSVSLYLMWAAFVGRNFNRKCSRRIFLSVVVLGTYPDWSVVSNLCTLLRVSLCSPRLSTALAIRLSSPSSLAAYLRPGLRGACTFISYCAL